MIKGNSFMLPQEIEVWYVIPAIRKTLVKNLKKLELNQKDIAKLLRITPAAVSQYISNKRGKDLNFPEEIKKELLDGAQRIYDGECSVFIVTKILNVIRKSGFLFELQKKTTNLGKNCNKCDGAYIKLFKGEL